MGTLISIFVTTLMIFMCAVIEAHFDGFGIGLAVLLSIPNTFLFAYLTRR